jgi:two-component system, NarL family, nitrate/nitrite response regulator NarL
LADRIRVALLDNHPLFRRGIHDALAGTKLSIVAEGEATEDAAQTALKEKPEIVLMDIDGEGEGIRLAERILLNLTSGKVVILTASSDEEDIAEALRIGVHGYILKGVGAIELVTALEGIFDGQPYITPALATRLLLRDKGQSLRPSKDKELVFTARDKQVLGHLAEGLTNEEIAERLGLNTRTIKHYLTGVFRKMRVRNRVEAVVRAKAMGICN